MRYLFATFTLLRNADAAFAVVVLVGVKMDVGRKHSRTIFPLKLEAGKHFLLNKLSMCRGGYLQIVYSEFTFVQFRVRPNRDSSVNRRTPPIAGKRRVGVKGGGCPIGSSDFDCERDMGHV